MILDASGALMAALPELPSSQRDRLDHVLAEAGLQGDSFAPALYVYEVGQAVFVNRRDEIGPRAHREAVYQRLLALVDVVAVTVDELLAGSKLARPALSFYDAAYLALAERIREPLVTADRALYVAARRRRIESFLLPRDLAKMENRFFSAS